MQSADVELREACGRAWMKAGLHHIGKQMQPPRHRHHSERPKVRQQRRRERPQAEDTRIRLWLCPELKAERVAEARRRDSAGNAAVRPKAYDC